jgi:hypothetical protein
MRPSQPVQRCGSSRTFNYRFSEGLRGCSAAALLLSRQMADRLAALRQNYGLRLADALELSARCCPRKALTRLRDDDHQ